MAAIVVGDISKNDILEMSGVMKAMERDIHNIESVEGLIEKIKENCNYDNNDKLSDYSIDLDEVIKIIEEYCEVSDNDTLYPDKTKCKWIHYDYRTVCPKEHDVDNPYWRIPENRMDVLRYCPYCGKEIEIEADKESDTE